MSFPIGLIEKRMTNTSKKNRRDVQISLYVSPILQKVPPSLPTPSTLPAYLSAVASKRCLSLKGCLAGYKVSLEILLLSLANMEEI